MNEVRKILELRIIEPSESPYCSPRLSKRRMERTDFVEASAQSTELLCLLRIPNTDDIFAKLYGCKYVNISRTWNSFVRWVGKQFELLNCDKHKNLAKKFKRDISKCRPDITHQCLLMLMDSPLNRAGLLQVYIHMEKNVLIEVNPFDRFCGLMVQLLHKFSIHAADGPQKLLKVIKNPVTDHLPTGCKKIGTSFHVDKVTDVRDLVPSDEPVAFVVGAMAHGSIDIDYTEDLVSISNYPLSAALACAKVCTAFEEKWGVV